MSRYGTITGNPANARSYVVQSADPQDLLALSGVAGVAAFGDMTDPVVTSISLTGAGDGHMFFLEVQGAPSADVDGGADLIGGAGFLAADAASLSKLLASVNPSGPILDVHLAGSSKGQRVMGIVSFGTLRASSASPRRIVEATNSGAATSNPPTYPGTEVLSAPATPLEVTFAQWTPGDVLTISWWAWAWLFGEGFSVLRWGINPVVDVGAGFKQFAPAAAGGPGGQFIGPIGFGGQSGSISLVCQAAPKVRLLFFNSDGDPCSLPANAAILRAERTAAAAWETLPTSSLEP